MRILSKGTKSGRTVDLVTCIITVLLIIFAMHLAGCSGKNEDGSNIVYEDKKTAFEQSGMEGSAEESAEKQDRALEGPGAENNSENSDPAEKGLDENPESAYEGKKLIAITVDDGPDGAGTEEYLKIAKEFDIPLTFFVIGKNIKGHENQLVEMMEAGCEIGNHSYSHGDLTGLDAYGIRKEINDANDAIVSAVNGDVVRFVRAPYFSYSDELSENVGYPMIDAALQEGSSAKETLKTLQEATDGDIVLMHSSMSTSREALREAIPYLIEQGFAFVTVSQLFEICGVEPANGSVYRHVGRNVIRNYNKARTIFEGESFASGDWNQWAPAFNLEKDDLKTCIKNMTEKDAIKVEYRSLAGPCFILMDWDNGGPGWIQVTPSFDDGKQALFTYEDMFTAYGFGEDLSTVDGAQVRPFGADVTVTKVEFLSRE